MKELSLTIMELLAISLGIDRSHYRRFFEDGDSIMRCNYYPPCNSSSVTLGTGPHSDPTSLTILHQDQVGGLEVFADNKWMAVRPRHEALVINIGDTFMVCKFVLSNMPKYIFLRVRVRSPFLRI
jgi:gibberellin 20-oxidase